MMNRSWRRGDANRPPDWVLSIWSPLWWEQNGIDIWDCSMIKMLRWSFPFVVFAFIWATKRNSQKKHMTEPGHEKLAKLDRNVRTSATVITKRDRLVALASDSHMRAAAKFEWTANVFAPYTIKTYNNKINLHNNCCEHANLRSWPITEESLIYFAACWKSAGSMSRTTYISAFLRVQDKMNRAEKTCCENLVAAVHEMRWITVIAQFAQWCTWCWLPVTHHKD